MYSFYSCFHFRLLNDSAEVVLGSSNAPETGLYNQMGTLWPLIDNEKIELIDINDRDDLIAFGRE